MRRSMRCVLFSMAAGWWAASPCRPADLPRFRGEEIDPAVGKVCYAVAISDVDGDGRPDIVAVANDAVLWYQNPTWTKRDIIRGATEPDNVCLQPCDVDRDGRVDFALGSAWRPSDTTGGGNLAILTRTAAPEGTWRVVPIGSEPTLHRLRWGDVLREGTQPQLVVAPLQGRNTRGPDWGAGAGSRITAWTIPARPFSDPWVAQTVTADLHTVHNLQIVEAGPLLGKAPAGLGVLAATWEGVFLLHRDGDQAWRTTQLGAGDQLSRPNRGASEAKLGRLRDGSPFVATIEPWHGSQFVVYSGPKRAGAAEMNRQVVDPTLAWGHAIWCADIDGDGDDEVVVGQRDPNPAQDPSRRGPGVILFDPRPGTSPIAFDRTWIDQGGVAVEDLVEADLNNDGRLDIVAGGRATHNVKIYWNEPPTRP